MSLIVDLFNDSLEDSIEKFYKIFNITLKPIYKQISM